MNPMASEIVVSHTCEAMTAGSEGAGLTGDRALTGREWGSIARPRKLQGTFRL